MTEQSEGKYYHTKCLSPFCATKRQPQGDSEHFPPSKATHSTSGTEGSYHWCFIVLHLHCIFHSQSLCFRISFLWNLVFNLWLLIIC